MRYEESIRHPLSEKASSIGVAPSGGRFRRPPAPSMPVIGSLFYSLGKGTPDRRSKRVPGFLAFAVARFGPENAQPVAAPCATDELRSGGGRALPYFDDDPGALFDDGVGIVHRSVLQSDESTSAAVILNLRPSLLTKGCAPRDCGFPVCRDLCAETMPKRHSKLRYGILRDKFVDMIDRESYKSPGA